MNGPGPGASSPPRRGELALAFQEILTVTERLRRGQAPTSDSGFFRTHVKGLLADADERARVHGYHGTYAKLATYATVAFLDESVLEGERPLFPDWAGRPLQEEIFGDNVAGEHFYQNLEELLQHRDSEELADVLEIHLLCLLLGFRGMYSSRPPDELAHLTHRIQRSIERIRGSAQPLSPVWQPSQDETVPPREDVRTRTLAQAALFTVLLALALYGFYWLNLGRTVAPLVQVDAPAGVLA